VLLELALSLRSTCIRFNDNVLTTLIFKSEVGISKSY
jgi:hypothetical protein